MKTKLTIIALALLAILNVSQANDAKKVYTVEELLTSITQLTGTEVTVTGRATHVCSRSGNKIFLATTDGKRTLRFNAGADLKKFDRQAVSKTVIITGTVHEQRINMDALNKQEQSAIEAEKAKKAVHHCSSEAKADGEDLKSTALQRIQMQKARLQKQIDNGGNPYLSFYSVTNCNSYSFN